MNFNNLPLFFILM